MLLKELIKKCKRNNREAQSKLFELYKDKLFVLCLKYCRNYQEAEDNLQESFIAIFEGISKYKFEGSFEGWMKRIVINKAIDRNRKIRHLDVPIKEEILADTLVWEYEIKEIDLDKLLSIVQSLPNQYRLVFNLFELDNYSHKEIANMLAISESTSKSNLHRAKILLKQKLTSENCIKKIVKNG